MTPQRLRSLIVSKASCDGINATYLYNAYFFERLLYRISISEYRNNLIFKGGFLLQNMVGSSVRSTLDMDFEYQRRSMSEAEIQMLFENICSLDVDDGVNFSMESITQIKAQMDYPGFSVKIKGQLGNVHSHFWVDIATGDIVTPTPQMYKYESIVEKESFPVLSYNKETMFAEKIQTLICKGTINSRSKDLYDIGLFSEMELDSEIFNDSVVNTFRARGTRLNHEYMIGEIKKIRNDKAYRDRFQSFCVKHQFASRCDFDHLMEVAKDKVDSLLWIEKLHSRNSAQIFFMRHGQACNNGLGAWADYPLSETGRVQVQNAALTLKDCGIRKIICSDLRRTKETADIVSSILGISVEYDSRLREMNESHPDAESSKDFLGRVSQCFKEIMDNSENDHTLIVTHGGVLGVLMSLVDGIQWSNKQKCPISECQIFKLQVGKDGAELSSI